MKLKSIKSDHRKDQIEQYTMIGSSVQTRADFKSTNPDPIQNNRINNHETKTIIESKLKNMTKKSKYVTKYVFR